MANAVETAKRLERILGHAPGVFRNGKNFRALFGSIAQSDADLENLFIDVKKQLFVDTAEGGYLDKLGSNVGVTRPPLIGMVDTDFRDFIKLQTYYPKQIRQLLFRLMELFYGRDTIKANIRSTEAGPFNVFDGANLLVRVDNKTDVEIVFSSANFNDPTSVSAEEIVAQINTQIRDFLFASTYFNAIDKQDFVEIYTDTFGPVGSVEIRGGSANRFLKFPTTFRSGSTINTRYRLVKELSTMKLYWAGGDNPLFSQLRVGDSAILTGEPFAAGNSGSFPINEITDTGVPATVLSATAATYQSAHVVRYSMASTANVVAGKEVVIAGFTNSSNNGTFTVSTVSGSYIDVVSPRVSNTDDETASATVDLLPNASHITFVNDNGFTASIFSLVSSDDVLFLRPKRRKLESAKRPATVWEVTANEIIVSLPATPVVVRRGLAGSAHMQGTTAVISKAFTTTVNLRNPEFFPLIEGSFFLQKPNGFIDRSIKYRYDVASDGHLLNVTPQIKPVGDKLKLGTGPLSATSSSNVLTVTTLEPHGLTAGELVRLANFDSFAGLSANTLNVTIAVASVVDAVSFTVNLVNPASSTATNGPSVNKGQIFTTTNSKVVITNVQQNTGYVGSYIYDEDRAQYTIAETQTTVQQDLLLGEFGGSVRVHDSTVFAESAGEIIVNYGRADEEGPIKYIAKPSSSTIFIDPSYRYTKSHESGAAINIVRSKFATAVGPSGKQLPVYVVDTIGPREKLKELLLDAKAAGISVTFVVILPDNVYNAFSLYESQS